MKNVTEKMNDHYQQVMDMQSRILEPVRIFAAVTADSVEQIARMNYAVVGDALEFSTRQAQLPLFSENLTDVSSAQADEASAFAELMNSRASEYADMAQQFSSNVKQASESAAASFK